MGLSDKKRKAFTLIEILIDIFVVSVIAAAVLTAYSGSFRSMSYASAKITAVALANEQMEQLRNMTYDSLATVHGPIYPSGNLPDDQQIQRNGVIFNVHASIYYFDDPFDGNSDGTIAGKPKDLYPFDYKKAEITVSRNGFNGYLSRITSNIAAKAAETPTNSGIVKLCVVDATGAPVSDAAITIQNPNAAPPVDVAATTGSDGCIMVPNLPPSSHNQYHVTATKDGYSTDMTYPRTAQNPNAEYPDLDVLIQQVTSKTLVIDKLSTIKLNVLDESSQPVANTLVHIDGAKEMYFNPSTYKFSKDFTTDANGQIFINDAEFDDYSISVSGWNIFSTSPYQPVGLKPSTDLTVTVNVTHSSTMPRITSCSPISVRLGSVANLTFTGDNFVSGASVKILNNAGVEIIGTNVIVSQGEKIDVDFQLLGAQAGNYDVIITNPNGDQVKQTGGLEITS